MIVKLLRRDLLQAIKILKPFTKTPNEYFKNRIAFDLISGNPILANSVIIKVADGVSYGMKFIPTYVEGNGRICLDIIKLASVLRYLRGAYIAIEYPYGDKEFVNVKSVIDGTSFSFKADQNYSELYDRVVEFDCPVKVPDHHRVAFGEVLPLTSTDSYRPMLQNIYFDGETIRATNGFSAGYRKFSMGDFRGLIPADLVRTVCRSFPHGFSTFFGQKDDHVAFRTIDVFVSTRIGEGNFPDIDAIIRKEPKLIVESPLTNLRNIFMSARVFMTKSDHGGVLLSIDKDGEATIDVDDEEYRYDARHKFNVEYAADMDYPFNIGINPILFSEFVSGFYPSEHVRMSFTTLNEPIKIEVKSRSFTGVLMPMHMERVLKYRRG